MKSTNVNGDPSDNRLCNLRLATRSQNLQNQHRVRRDNKSGVTGVFWGTREQRWLARIGIDGKEKHIGSYTTKEAAAEARRRAEETLHPFRDRRAL